MQPSIGMAHGRFQPLHKEHLEYILRVLSSSSRLVVGITNPEPAEFREDLLSPHRHQQEANPYTYFQRSEMIRESLTDEGVEMGRISIVPFHLFNPERWKSYLPRPQAVVQFVRAFSPWEDKKIELFRAQGFRVEILDRRARKNIEGVMVRQRMRSGDDWKSLVPAGTIRVVEKVVAGEL